MKFQDGVACIHMIRIHNIEEKLGQFAERVRMLIGLLKSKQNKEGVSSIGTREIAKGLHVTSEEARELLDNLIRLGLVEKTGFNTYRVVHEDLERTPFGVVTGLARILSALPNASYQEQAQVLGIPQKQLELVYGQLLYYISA